MTWLVISLIIALPIVFYSIDGKWLRKRYPKSRKLMFVRRYQWFILSICAALLFLRDPLKGYFDDRDAARSHGETMNTLNSQGTLDAPMGDVEAHARSELHLIIGTVGLIISNDGHFGGYVGFNKNYMIRAYVVEDQLIVDADWVNEQGRLVVVIRNNQFRISTNEYRIDRPAADEFAVLFSNGEDAFRVKRRNATEAVVTGTFYSAKGSRMIADKEGVKPDYMVPGDSFGFGFYERK